MIPPGFARLGARIGLSGAFMALLGALLIVQTLRLEGFKLWPLEIEGALPRGDRLQRTIDRIEEAQRDALARHRAEKAAAERRYRELAERIDDEAEQARAGAMDDAERYIAAHRVRCPGTGSAPGGPAPAAADRGPESGQGPGAPPELDDAVAVMAEDVRICTANTLQAEAARAWALELERASAERE